jgi:hypothetical protein
MADSSPDLAPNFRIRNTPVASRKTDLLILQRLPQYRLLLEDYLKHLDPQSPDFDDTTQVRIFIYIFIGTVLTLTTLLRSVYLPVYIFIGTVLTLTTQLRSVI